MTLDRADFSSVAATFAIHIMLVLAFSAAVIKAPPKKVALLTDVALIDSSEYRGQKGQEEKSVGVAPVQKKLGTTVKKAVTKPAPPKPVDTAVKKEEPDIKSLLKKIEEQKAALETGISRENLREARTTDTGEEGQTIEETSDAVEGERSEERRVGKQC